MKIVEVNDNLKVNIEQIYSLERLTNEYDILNWSNAYTEYVKQFSEDPPYLPIDEENIYKPEIGKTIDPELMEKYSNALNKYIIDIIGDRPEYIEEYQIILSTGLKVNVSKDIYDKVDKAMIKYIIK